MTTLRRVCAAVLIAVGLPAGVHHAAAASAPAQAWPMRGHDYGASSVLPGSGIGPSTVGTLAPSWRFAADGAIPGSPAVGRQAVFVGSSRGTIYALDLRTGRPRWSVNLGSRPETAYGFPSLGISGTPALAAHRVYAATANTDVVCLDSATGGFMWRTRVGDLAKSETIWSAPLVWDNMVFVGIDGVFDEPSVRGRVVALDATSGRILWTYVVPQYTGGGGAGVFSSPALDAATGTLFVTTGNPTPKEAPPPGPDPGSDSILALDAKTGHLRWAFGPTHPHDTRDLDFLVTPNVFPLPSGTAVGAGEKDGIYYTVDARTGALLWKTSLTLAGERGAVITGGAAVALGRIYVGTQDYPPSATGFSPDLPGRLVALDARTGRIVWTVSGATQILGTPAAAGGVVFAADYSGTVWGVDAQSGRVLWKGSTGGFAWKGGVALAPGMVLVGASDPANALVAFGLTPAH